MRLVSQGLVVTQLSKENVGATWVSSNTIIPIWPQKLSNKYEDLLLERKKVGNTTQQSFFNPRLV